MEDCKPLPHASEQIQGTSEFQNYLSQASVSLLQLSYDVGSKVEANWKPAFWAPRCVWFNLLHTFALPRHGLGLQGNAHVTRADQPSKDLVRAW